MPGLSTTDRAQVSNLYFARMALIAWVAVFASALYQGYATGGWGILKMWAAVTALPLGLSLLMSYATPGRDDGDSKQQTLDDF